MPRVSVLMAHTGDTEWLEPALESVARQSFEDFELIIVDDGANLDWSRWLALPPERTRVLRNGRRRGLAWSLNAGLEQCSGDLVARMDSDDISLPSRLAEQVRWLDANPSVDLVGTAVRYLGSGPAAMSRSYPITHPSDIELALLAYNQFAHGSIMVRRTALIAAGGYDATASVAQDYELWIRLSGMGRRLANLPSVEYEHRVHRRSVSNTRGAHQADAARRFRVEKRASIAPALARFFSQNRDARLGRPYEALQLGKLALLVGYLATRAGVPADLRARASAFCVKHAVDAARLIQAEGRWQSQGRRWLGLLRE